MHATDAKQVDWLKLKYNYTTKQGQCLPQNDRSGLSFSSVIVDFSYLLKDDMFILFPLSRASIVWVEEFLGTQKSTCQFPVVWDSVYDDAKSIEVQTQGLNTVGIYTQEYRNHIQQV